MRPSRSAGATAAILSDGDRLRFPGLTLAVALAEDRDAHDAFRAVLPPRQDAAPPAAGGGAPRDDRRARPAGQWGANLLDDIALPEATGGGAPFEAASFSSLNLAASALDGGPFAWAEGPRLDPAPGAAAPVPWSRLAQGDRSEPEHQAFPTGLPGPSVIPDDWDLEAPNGIGADPAIPPDWVDRSADPPSPAVAPPALPGDDALVLALVTALARIERALLGPETGLMQGPPETMLRRLRATEPALAQRAITLIAERAAERIEVPSRAPSPDALQDRTAGPQACADTAPPRPGDHDA